MDLIKDDSMLWRNVVEISCCKIDEKHRNDYEIINQAAWSKLAEVFDARAKNEND